MWSHELLDGLGKLRTNIAMGGPKYIQQILGHFDERTTDGYLHKGGIINSSYADFRLGAADN